MKNIAIFASGNGSNFEAIAKAIASGYIPAKLVLLVVNKKDAYVIQRAKQYGIETYILSLKDCLNKIEYEQKIVYQLKERKVDLICLAGYMLYCGKTLLEAYSNQIINIHPALLPSFKGAHGIEDAYTYGVKVFGVTVHYVDDGIDSGKIIDQAAFHKNDESLEEIENKIHELEHELYPRVIKKLVEGV
ncbi:MAG: phosphoribosylglycinamide formyltransferase [Anaeroplasmataceae bacterium]|nr:phosphoribosylglycinamide formyltransferase [Anaeroplasmataceae bacterium]